MSQVPRSVSKVAREATEPLVFVVGPEHVKGSVVGDNHQCAGACALKARDDVADAYVNRHTAYIKNNDGVWTRYRSPSNLMAAVDSFDEFSGLFPPGEYTLKPVSSSQTLAAHKIRSRYAKKRGQDDPDRQIKRRPRTHGLR